MTVIEAATIANRDDAELVDGLRIALTRRGVTILEGVAVTSAEPGPVLVLQDGQRIAGSHLLVAVGRQPNLETLKLEAAGVVASRLGVVTDRGLRCQGNKRVYAVGDIADPVGIGPRAFTHVGLYHAGIVIRRALFRLPARLNYAALPRVTYTDPELAQTGVTEAEAKAAGRRIRVLRWPMSENDRAVAEQDETGLVKLVVSGNRVIGAGILAPHAGEMIGQWTLAIARKIPLSAMAGLIVPYPPGRRPANVRPDRSRRKIVLRAHQSGGPIPGPVVQFGKLPHPVTMAENESGAWRSRCRGAARMVHSPGACSTGCWKTG